MTLGQCHEERYSVALLEYKFWCSAKSFSTFISLNVCVCICAHMCEPYLCAGAQGGQTRALDPLELLSVGAGIRTGVLWWRTSS